MITLGSILCTLLAACCVPLSSRAEADHWSSFRAGGSSATAVVDLPKRWSDESGLAWRASLEGYGQSSPVIWGGRVYVTSTAGERKETLHLEAFDLADGARVWERTFEASLTVPEVSRMISQGAPTPVADADGIYVFFESGDLVALTHEGATRWSRSLTRDYEPFRGNHGIGTSLVDTPRGLALLIDHEGPSYLLLIDKATGETRWKRDRPPRVSWTTPLFVEHEGEAQLIVSSNGELASFRLDDGERLWWLDGLQKNTVASPSTDGAVVVIGSSQPRQSLAVELGGRGDIADTHVRWRAEKVTSSFGSPLIHRDAVYFVNRAGALQCTDLADGRLRWERRLPASTWASPLAAPDGLYFFCNDGQTVVLPPGSDGETEPVSTNRLSLGENDRLYGFAVTPGRIVMRTGRELVVAGELP